MKRIIISLTLVLIMIFAYIPANAQAEELIDLDISMIENGVVGVSCNNISDSGLKIQIYCNGSKMYYDIKDDGEIYNIPLQLGNGRYRIALLENTTGYRYRYIHVEYFDMDLDNENIVYLASSIYVNWNENMEAIKYAAMITENAETTEEKIKIIYNYITNNYVYDYEKINNIDSYYIPDIDEIYDAEKGICYDYAAIFASMLRSVGIPAKLIKGYYTPTGGYHAWNEVYLEDTGEWVIMDLTRDAAFVQKNITKEMYKDTNDYSVKYKY